jgi:hypothetical protein
MEALGRLFDVGIGWAPVDLDTADGATGKRIAMSGADAITFVVTTAVGASAAMSFNVRQHTAYTAGTSADLDPTGATGSVGITSYYLKSEALLDNDEAWTRVTQTEDSAVAIPAATGLTQYVLVIEVSGNQLAEGYTHLSLEATGTLAAPKLSSCLYFMHELRLQRKPTKLGNLLRPNAANA